MLLMLWTSKEECSIEAASEQTSGAVVTCILCFDAAIWMGDVAYVSNISCRGAGTWSRSILEAQGIRWYCQVMCLSDGFLGLKTNLGEILTFLSGVDRWPDYPDCHLKFGQLEREDGDTDERVGMWLVHACAGHHTDLELCNVSACIWICIHAP